MDGVYYIPGAKTEVVYYIPGAKTEVFKRLAAAYEEASKLPGLPSDVVLSMLAMRDEYIALATEDEARPL